MEGKLGKGREGAHWQLLKARSVHLGILKGPNRELGTEAAL